MITTIESTNMIIHPARVSVLFHLTDISSMLTIPCYQHTQHTGGLPMAVDFF
jgi:hypothetical protein